jgi:hypothetical protein
MNDQPAGQPAAIGEPGPEDIWRAPLTQLLNQLATKAAGLTETEARSRLTKYGPNDASTVKS